MKQIPGTEDYFITESGDVFSFCGVGCKPKRRTVPIKIKPVMISGYKNVSIKRGGVHKRVMVHTLLLETFVGPCPDGCECRHLDGNRTNNDLSNLSWGTYQQNQRDRTMHGTSNRGERQGRHKLSEKDVLDIIKMFGKARISQIARKFNVSDENILAIRDGRSWTWLTGIKKTRRAKADERE